MKFRVEIDLDNDAFQDSRLSSELADILHGLSNDIEFTELAVDREPVTLYDSNGNSVGVVEFVDEK